MIPIAIYDGYPNTLVYVFIVILTEQYIELKYISLVTFTIQS